MHTLWALIKFIVGGVAGTLVWTFGFGCLMACNGEQRVASDGVMYIVLLLCVVIGGVLCQGDDAFAITKTITGIVNAEKQRKRDRAAEIKQKEQQEADRKRKEQIEKLIMQTRTEILANQGYDLDILPFLNCLLSASRNDKEYEEVVRSSELRAIQLKSKAEELNKIAEQYNLDVKLQVHVR